MTSSERDHGTPPPRTPTLTLDTASATSTPPLLQQHIADHDAANNHAAAARLAGREFGDLSTLSIHADGRPVRVFPHVPQNRTSSAGSSTSASPALLVSITPLPSPAGSVSGSPISKRPPPLTPLSEIDDAPLRPTHLSPDQPPFSSPKLRPVSSNGSIRVHKRTRSRSEYTTSELTKPWQRITVSGSQTPTTAPAPTPGLQREEFLAEKRGIAAGDPDPGQMSESTVSNSSTIDTAITEDSGYDQTQHLGTGESFQAQSVKSGKTHTWRSIRQLGTGTFSRVMLGTREPTGPLLEERLPRISLAAIKICNLGPAGGADEKKIGVSLKRELDILRAIDHPSLIHLKAVSHTDSRALLVLNYCSGGDLFEVASSRQDVLTPGFVHRVFAELVGALKYLHGNWIVHRDIKLENVLVNIPPIELQHITDYERYPHSVVTLTDLGLGRFIPKPPENPLLSTRCGSEDYAAPELLMGQEYDGRSVDAWALGVLLYAMVEGRLPFDPVPGARRQSPKTHRIARCDWTWIKRADADGEWDDEKGKGFEGARECVENLLVRARSRWDVGKLSQNDWVKSGIQVESLTQHTVL